MDDDGMASRPMNSIQCSTQNVGARWYLDDFISFMEFLLSLNRQALVENCID